MNISSQISSIYESNSSDLFSNDPEAENDFEMFSVGYIISILMSFPVNCYMIWLIVRGTGNGLAAEIFILNLSVCEILLCVQTFLMFLTNTFQISNPWIIVAFLDGVFVIGHPLFECLICFERYLAVIHPVIFLKFKPLRYRLMCCAVAWVPVFAFGGFNVVILLFVNDIYIFFLIIPFLIFLFLKLFFLVAVLKALKQSGPGERGREREEENHMKRRAFNFILITTVSMLIIYFPYIIFIVLITPENPIFMCVGQICLTLAGLVQPVLFLYRVRKLNFIKC